MSLGIIMGGFWKTLFAFISYVFEVLVSMPNNEDVLFVRHDCFVCLC